MTSRVRDLVLGVAILGAAPAHAVVPGGMALTHYQLPPEPSLPLHIGYFALESQLTVEIEPAPLTYYFWAQQFWFRDGDGGYIGLQANGLQMGQWVGKMAIVSIWGSTAAVPAERCEPFDEFGTGWSCRLAFPWVEGETYRLRVTEFCCEEEPDEDEWWRATLTPLSTGVEIWLGDLKVPGGWDWLVRDVQVFKEYFLDVPSCAGVPTALVEWQGFAGDLGAASGVPQTSFTYGNCAAAARVGCTGDRCFHSVPLFADGFESGDTSVWSLTVP